MVRAIFLDIDGVICCNQFGRLEDRKLQLLRGVVQQTGAKIVLSTDWRRVPKLKSQLSAVCACIAVNLRGSTAGCIPVKFRLAIFILDFPVITLNIIRETREPHQSVSV